MNTYDLISLDVWDTILRRKCHPDEIKVATSRFIYLSFYNYIKDEYKNISNITKNRIDCELILGNKCRQNGYDDEYNIREVFTLLVNKIFNHIVNLELIVEKIYNFELNQEKNNVYLDNQIVQLVESNSYKQIAYISDFYAESSFIDDLLMHVNFPIKLNYKYSSCEHFYNKRSGRLFDYVYNNLENKEIKHLHIGDNKHSDFNIPNSKGIEGFHYINKSEEDKRKALNKNFEQRNIGRVETYFTEEILNNDGNNEDKIFNYGRDNAIFYYGFVSWIIEEAIKKNIDTIYYFTREGEFFKAIHDEICKINPYGVNIPKSEILEVSRIATFGASIENFTIKEMMRLWNQYSIQRVESIFKSINIDLNVVNTYLEKYSIDKSETITYPWLDERIKLLFKDKDLKRTIENELLGQRNKLKGYMNQKGFDDNQKEKIIVDIGWRGTIQDNIANIYSNKKIYGYYLGLNDFLNKQPDNVEKYGYVNSESDYKTILKFITPLEMICNSPNGSTIGYKYEDNDIIAIRKVEKSENDTFFKYTKYYQNGVLNKIREIAQTCKVHGLSEDELKSISINKLKNILYNPQRHLATAYFNLRHNEEFGVGNFVDKKTRLNIKIFIKGLISEKYRHELVEFLNETSWPQGYMIKYNMQIINDIYNKKVIKK